MDAVTGTKALFILAENNPLRKFAKRVVDSSQFEYVILLTTLANCIVLAQYEYLPYGDKKQLSIQLDSTELYFLVIFCIEGLLKILAFGFLLQPKAYLRNAWNCLDFVNIATGVVASAVPSFNQPALRSLRVLRMLKLVTGISSLQVVMRSIIRAMAPLMRIGMLILAAIVVFAIIGVEFYNGIFHSACWNNDTNSFDLIESGLIMPCCINEKPLIGGLTCPDGYTCRVGWEGPSYGIQSFDNILLSMLTVFNIITMNGWALIMYETDDALGRAFNWLYFVNIVIAGGLFMLNLVLGVLSGEFANNRERVENRRLFLKIRRQQEIERDFEHYINWICQAEDIILAEERTTEEERSKIAEARRIRALRQAKTVSGSTNSSLERRRACHFCYRFWKAQKRLRNAVRRILKSQAFYWTIIVLVLFDTVLISSEHIGEPPWLTDILYYGEIVFLGLFFGEMLIKMYGLGYRSYFKSSFNKFDCAVILASLFEVIWQIFHPDSSFGFAVLRSMRLLRIFKITRYWSALRNLVLSLLNSVRSIVSLLFLLFIFIVICSLLGMQLFGGQWNFDEGRPDANYDTFTDALLTVFQILTGEDWNTIMYDAIRSQGGPNSGGLIYCLYFIVIIIFGSYTLLNVFIAIAVDNLAKAQELTAAEEEEANRKETDAAADQQGLENFGMETYESGNLPVLFGGVAPPQVTICPPSPSISENPNNKATEDIQKESSLDLSRADAIDVATPEQLTKRRNSLQMMPRDQDQAETGGSFDSNVVEPTPGSVIPPKPINSYRSLFLFAPTNPVRIYAHFAVNLWLFDVFMLFMLCASSISLAVEDPVQTNSFRNTVLNYLDYVFVAVFTVEMLLKVVDVGFVLHPGSYCRDPWNILDLVVVLCALATLIFVDSDSTMKNLGTVKSLRVLRVLRPLKSIRRIPKLKAVFDCLVTAVKNVLVIMVIYLLFQLIFAVIGVQLFKGTFNYCTDLSKETENVCKGEFIDYTQEPPVTVQREWKRSPLHYDNVGAALLTLFTVQTRSGWPTLLRFSMASTFEAHGPKPGYNNNLALFYILYFVVFPFFFLNIFVALIVVTFQEQGEAELKDLDLDKNQKNCIDFVINSKPVNFYAPQNKQSIRYLIWSWIMSKPYDYCMTFIVILNTITLMMKFYNQPPLYQSALFYLNIVFTSIFGLEVILKLFGFGVLNYFRQPWNIFDFISVVGSIADMLITSINMSFLRLFRATRLIKILRQSRSIRILLWTFVQSLNALPYVLLLIGMLFYIYAVIGMQLFGNIVLDSDREINRHNNFQNFPDALLVLFRCATLDSWVGIMLSCMSGRPCDPLSYSSDVTPPPTCGLDLAIAYFVSFVFLSSFLMLNLFIAVIMDNFDYLTRDSSILGPHHLEEFLHVWSNYDHSASGQIHHSEMYDMLKELEPPVGFGKKCPNRLAYRKLIRMNMPVHKYGRVNFKTTLFALVRESLGIKVSRVEEMDRKDKELRKIIRLLWPLQSKTQITQLIPSKEELTYGKMTVGKIYTGMLMAQNWKHYKLKNSVSLQEEEGQKGHPSFLHRFLGTVNNYWTRRNSRLQTSDEETLVEDLDLQKSRRPLPSIRRLSEEIRKLRKHNDGLKADENQGGSGSRKNSSSSLKNIKDALAGVAAVPIQTAAIKTRRTKSAKSSHPVEDDQLVKNAMEIQHLYGKHTPSDSLNERRSHHRMDDSQGLPNHKEQQDRHHEYSLTQKVRPVDPKTNGFPPKIAGYADHMPDTNARKQFRPHMHRASAQAHSSQNTTHMTTRHHGRRSGKDRSPGNPDIYHASPAETTQSATAERLNRHQEILHRPYDNNSANYFHGSPDQMHSEQMLKKSESSGRIQETSDRSLNMPNNLRRPQIIPSHNQTLPKCNSCHRIRKREAGPHHVRMPLSAGNASNTDAKPSQSIKATNSWHSKTGEPAGGSRPTRSLRPVKGSPQESVPMAPVRRKHSLDLHKNPDLPGNLSINTQLTQNKVPHIDKEMPAEANQAFGRDDDINHTAEDKITQEDSKSNKKSDFTQRNATETMPYAEDNFMPSYNKKGQHEDQPITNHTNLPPTTNFSDKSSMRPKNEITNNAETLQSGKQNIPNSHKDSQPTETGSTAISNMTLHDKTHLENYTVLHTEDDSGLTNSSTGEAEATTDTDNPSKVLPIHNTTSADDVSKTDSVPVWGSFLATAGKIFGIKKVSDNKELEKPSNADDDRVEKPNSPVRTFSDTTSTVVDVSGRPTSSPAEQASPDEQSSGHQQKAPSAEKSTEQTPESNETSKPEADTKPMDSPKPNSECVVS